MAATCVASWRLPWGIVWPTWHVLPPQHGGDVCGLKDSGHEALSENEPGRPPVDIQPVPRELSHEEVRQEQELGNKLRPLHWRQRWWLVMDDKRINIVTFLMEQLETHAYNDKHKMLCFQFRCVILKIYWWQLNKWYKSWVHFYFSFYLLVCSLNTGFAFK